MGQRRMSTDAHFLTLNQWFSPAFPTGAFAYSHGLETAIKSGQIATSGDLYRWLADVLEHGSGRNDCILLRAAYRCEDEVALSVVNATARAFVGASERLKETTLQGAALTKTINAIWGGDAPDCTNPVAVGWAARRLGLPINLTASMYLQAFASNLVSAAVRLVPLGQTEGQATMSDLTPLCAEIAEVTETADIDDLHSTAFLSDIAAMQHETLQHRIFRT
jgi:urease accessory protein